MTHQRREVLRAVVAAGSHPDAETVLRRVREVSPTVSLDTVYRTLAFLEEHGLISRVHVAGERTRYDGNAGTHHHFVCTVCGRIADFSSPELDRLPVPREALQWGRAKMKQLQVFGTCTECERHTSGGETT